MLFDENRWMDNMMLINLPLQANNNGTKETEK